MSSVTSSWRQRRQAARNRRALDRAMAGANTPAMRDELKLSASEIGFATSAFFWGYIILQIPAGRLAGVWSAKRVIMLLLVLWSAASLTTSLVHTQTELIINRFALGVSSRATPVPARHKPPPVALRTPPIRRRPRSPSGARCR